MRRGVRWLLSGPALIGLLLGTPAFPQGSSASSPTGAPTSAVDAGDAEEAARIARSLKAHDYDPSLPDEPVDAWLARHLPPGYTAVWGQYITDCGEGTGSPEDAERDLPLCAEVEIRQGGGVTGYLLLVVGTRKGGLQPDRAGLFFGELTHTGRSHRLQKLGDLLTVK